MMRASAGQRAVTKVPVALQVLAALSLLISLFLAVRYSGQHLLEAHVFRQTQTALTSYWLWRDGFRLAYQTPSVGAPWSIPFEFPIYEWIVAAVSAVLGIDLERTGRLISYTFLLACLWPVSNILRHLFPEKWRLQLAFFVPLFLLSPLYLFWGRSFMIETAALFFTLAGVSTALPFLEGRACWRDTVWTFVLLTLAFLQKSTTVLPVWLILLGAIGFVSLRSGRSAAVRRLMNPKIAIAFVLPVVLGWAWIRFTDDVKMQNLAGQHLTSAGLSAWNYGPLRMRFSSDLWYRAVWNRILLRNAGGPIGVALLAGALTVGSRRTRLFLVAALAAFLLPILTFTNLHYVHDYYQAANVVYLVLALAVALSALWTQLSSRRTPLAIALLFILLADAASFLYTGYAASERVQFTLENNRTLALAEYLKANTPPSDPLVVFGLDWSAELPFFSNRRALGVPNWLTLEQQKDIALHPSRYVEKQPSAILFCGSDYDAIKPLVHPQPFPPQYGIEGCEVKLSGLSKVETH